MATVDDKIDAASTDISAAVAEDLNALVAVLSDVVQAVSALQTLHPMAPAVLAPIVARAKARIEDMRVKLNG